MIAISVDGESVESARRALRPRFSLLNTLLLVTALALATVVWRQDQELRWSTNELQSLRRQLGLLTINDPKQVHGVEVKEAGGHRWQWRIYLPGGRDFYLHMADNVPSAGIPSRSNSRAFLGMRKGELTLIAEVRPTETGERHLYIRSDGNRESGIKAPYLSVEDSDWVHGRAQTITKVAGSNGQFVADPDEPVVLLRHREVSQQSGETSEGIVLWLTDRK